MEIKFKSKLLYFYEKHQDNADYDVIFDIVQYVRLEKRAFQDVTEGFFNQNKRYIFLNLADECIYYDYGYYKTTIYYKKYSKGIDLLSFNNCFNNSLRLL